MSVETKDPLKPRWAVRLSWLLVGLFVLYDVGRVVLMQGATAFFRAQDSPSVLSDLRASAQSEMLLRLLAHDLVVLILALVVIWLLVCIQKAAQS